MNRNTFELPVSTTLNLDLDGFLADFDEGFKSRFGKCPKSIPKQLKWELVHGARDFFLTLQPIPGAIDFFRTVRHLNPVILTGCPHYNYESAAKQKRAWSRLNLDRDITVLPCLGSSRKYLFMHRLGDVLVDDRRDVCNLWSDNGGRAILFEGDFDSVLQQLLPMFPTLSGVKHDPQR